jgi:hypothetical protein
LSTSVLIFGIWTELGRAAVTIRRKVREDRVHRWILTNGRDLTAGILLRVIDLGRVVGIGWCRLDPCALNILTVGPNLNGSRCVPFRHLIRALDH